MFGKLRKLLRGGASDVDPADEPHYPESLAGAFARHQMSPARCWSVDRIGRPPDEPAGARATQYPVVERAPEEVREDRNDIEAHWSIVTVYPFHDYCRAMYT